MSYIKLIAHVQIRYYEKKQVLSFIKQEQRRKSAVIIHCDSAQVGHPFCYALISYEPPRGKTNNVVSKQVGHKPDCTLTEDS